MAKGSSSAPGPTSHYLCLQMQSSVAAGVPPQQAALTPHGGGGRREAGGGREGGGAGAEPPFTPWFLLSKEKPCVFLLDAWQHPSKTDQKTVCLRFRSLSHVTPAF